MEIDHNPEYNFTVSCLFLIVNGRSRGELKKLNFYAQIKKPPNPKGFDGLEKNGRISLISYL